MLKFLKLQIQIRKSLIFISLILFTNANLLAVENELDESSDQFSSENILKKNDAELETQNTETQNSKAKKSETKSDRFIVSEIIGSILGAPGKMVFYGSNNNLQSKLNSDSHLKKLSRVRQCSAPLPIASDALPVEVTQMFHTWLEIDKDSYGMPFTDKKSYFGGMAHLFSPDPFERYTKNTKVCDPVYVDINADENKITKKIKCMAEKASLNTNINKFKLKDWQTTFDYHVFKNNCLSAINFLSNCGGFILSQSPNLGIGGKINYTDTNIQIKRSNLTESEFKNVYSRIASIAQDYQMYSLFCNNQNKESQKQCELEKQSILKRTEDLLLYSITFASMVDFHAEDIQLFLNDIKKDKTFDRKFESLLSELLYYLSSREVAKRLVPVDFVCEQLKSECDDSYQTNYDVLEDLKNVPEVNN